MKSNHSWPIFIPRKNDFTVDKGSKSLIKDHTLFKPTNGLRVGIIDNKSITCPDFGPHRNWCQNFKKSISSMIEHYKNTYGTDCLGNFAERENLRSCFAKKMIKEIPDSDSFFPFLMEDLRAPYYQNLFANKTTFSQLDFQNQALIDAIKADLEIEFSHTCSHTIKQTKHRFT